MINIVLYEPEIPPNTGNLIRLAANAGLNLHLIKPLGFDLDDKRMRRAGLDYHDYAALEVHDNWSTFVKKCGLNRAYGISTKGKRYYHQIQFLKGDFIIFGPESRGLPEKVRTDLSNERLLRIPMAKTSRSLNLSNAAAIVAYEAWRQNNFEGGL
jgi:tRNA (cytidine/uridine-2'-O-)-methyltransferase